MAMDNGENMNVGVGAIGGKAAVGEEVKKDAEVDDLQARLNNLQQ